MLKAKRIFIAIALVICFLVPCASVRAAENSAKAIAGIAMLGYTIATPEIAYPFALNPPLWHYLFNTFVPFLNEAAEPLRLIALQKAPTLNPTATPPQAGYPYVENTYKQVISFGDSMSDNGNMLTISRKLANWDLPASPNLNGRFTNGPVVLEVMSNMLNRPLLNYAFGGAMSGYTCLVPAMGFKIGMNKEVDDFINNLGWRSADSRALYVVWTGPDDFYKGVGIFDANMASQVTANIKSAMIKLYKRGARNFFIPGMPDLSITPAARIRAEIMENYLEAAHQRSSELATALTAMLTSFAKQYPLAKVRTFDTFTYSQVELQKYADTKNIKDPCYKPLFMGLPSNDVCTNPDDYLFWDENHPTAWGSSIIGAAFASAAVGTPLPSR